MELTEKFVYSESQLTHVTQTLAKKQQELNQALVDLDAANKLNKQLAEQLARATQGCHMQCNATPDIEVCHLNTELNALALHAHAKQATHVPAIATNVAKEDEEEEKPTASEAPDRVDVVQQMGPESAPGENTVAAVKPNAADEKRKIESKRRRFERD